MPVLSWVQVAAAARAGGWPSGPAVTAVAITMPESSRDNTAIQAGQPYATTGWGLWQITPGDSEPQCGIDNQLLDPVNNARAAWAKYTGAGGFSPWTTYENGLETPYLGDAAAAVSQVYGVPASALQQIINGIRQGVTGTVVVGAAVSNWSVHIESATAAVNGLTAAHLHTATATAALRSRFTPPAVPSPDPENILIHPERL